MLNLGVDWEDTYATQAGKCTKVAILPCASEPYKITLVEGGQLFIFIFFPQKARPSIMMKKLVMLLSVIILVK